MISIACTHCRAVLTIDDAFAGGVCRCQHCGTIQTVPADARMADAAASQSAKALYHGAGSGVGNMTVAASSASGLDDLAHAVASSSGLADSRLRGTPVAMAAPVAAPPPPPVTTSPAAQPELQPTRRKLPLIPIIAGLVVAILVAGGVFFLMHGKSGGDGTEHGPGDTGQTPTGPAFCDATISAPSVVYLLDRNSTIYEDFDHVRAATYQSIRSLGTGHKFAVLLWGTEGEDVTVPASGMLAATEDNVTELEQQIGGVRATGLSHLAGVLGQALGRNPGAIVIVTAKSELDDADKTALSDAVTKSAGKIKFYCFVVGQTDDNPALQAAAKSSGGIYQHLENKGGDLVLKS